MTDALDHLARVLYKAECGLAPPDRPPQGQRELDAWAHWRRMAASAINELPKLLAPKDMYLAVIEAEEDRFDPVLDCHRRIYSGRELLAAIVKHINGGPL